MQEAAIILALAALTVLAAASVSAPLWRGRSGAANRAAHEVAALKQQMRELDEEAARADLDPAAAEAARRELGRKLLRAADQHAASADIAVAPVGQARLAAMAVGAVILVGAGVYGAVGRPGMEDMPLAARDLTAERRALRPTQAQAEEIVARAHGGARPEAAGPAAERVAQARAALEAAPGDVGARLALAEALLNVGQAAESWRIFAAVRGEAAENAPPQWAVWQAHGMVIAAGGMVSQEAELLFRRAPGAPRSGYYLGLAAEQSGNPKEALGRWTALFRRAPSGPLRELLLRDIARVGAALQLDERKLVDRLRAEVGDAPPPPAAADGSAPALSAEDRAAVAAMSPEARMEMIEGMVAGLAERLKEEPDDLEGWLRLIRAYGVLGRGEDAQAALSRARAAFADDAAALARLEAQAAGPAGAEAGGEAAQ